MPIEGLTITDIAKGPNSPAFLRVTARWEALIPRLLSLDMTQEEIDGLQLVVGSEIQVSLALITTLGVKQG